MPQAVPVYAPQQPSRPKLWVNPEAAIPQWPRSPSSRTATSSRSVFSPRSSRYILLYGAGDPSHWDPEQLSEYVSKRYEAGTEGRISSLVRGKRLTGHSLLELESVEEIQSLTDYDEQLGRELLPISLELRGLLHSPVRTPPRSVLDIFPSLHAQLGTPSPTVPPLEPDEEDARTLGGEDNADGVSFIFSECSEEAGEPPADGEPAPALQQDGPEEPRVDGQGHVGPFVYPHERPEGMESTTAPETNEWPAGTATQPPAQPQPESPLAPAPETSVDTVSPAASVAAFTRPHVPICVYADAEVQADLDDEDPQPQTESEHDFSLATRDPLARAASPPIARPCDPLSRAASAGHEGLDPQNTDLSEPESSGIFQGQQESSLDETVDTPGMVENVETVKTPGSAADAAENVTGPQGEDRTSDTDAGVGEHTPHERIRQTTPALPSAPTEKQPTKGPKVPEETPQRSSKKASSPSPPSPMPAKQQNSKPPLTLDTNLMHRTVSNSQQSRLGLLSSQPTVLPSTNPTSTTQVQPPDSATGPGGIISSMSPRFFSREKKTALQPGSTPLGPQVSGGVSTRDAPRSATPTPARHRLVEAEGITRSASTLPITAPSSNSEKPKPEIARDTKYVKPSGEDNVDQACRPDDEPDSGGGEQLKPASRGALQVAPPAVVKPGADSLKQQIKPVGPPANQKMESDNDKSRSAIPLSQPGASIASSKPLQAPNTADISKTDSSGRHFPALPPATVGAAEGDVPSETMESKPNTQNGKAARSETSLLAPPVIGVSGSAGESSVDTAVGDALSSSIVQPPQGAGTQKELEKRSEQVEGRENEKQPAPAQVHADHNAYSIDDNVDSTTKSLPLSAIGSSIAEPAADAASGADPSSSLLLDPSVEQKHEEHRKDSTTEGNELGADLVFVNKEDIDIAPEKATSEQSRDQQVFEPGTPSAKVLVVTSRSVYPFEEVSPGMPLSQVLQCKDLHASAAEVPEPMYALMSVPFPDDCPERHVIFTPDVNKNQRRKALKNSKVAGGDNVFQDARAQADDMILDFRVHWLTGAVEVIEPSTAEIDPDAWLDISHEIRLRQPSNGFVSVEAEEGRAPDFTFLHQTIGFGHILLDQYPTEIHGDLPVQGDQEDANEFEGMPELVDAEGSEDGSDEGELLENEMEE